MEKYKNIPKVQLNISADRKCQKKLIMLLNAQNNMVRNLRVEERLNADVLGKINGHYQMLYSLYLSECEFSN